MLVIIIALVAHWYISLFFQTFFLHRYAAHQMFTMSKFTEKVFFVLTWIGQGASYLSPYSYGILHRMHHAYADTEKDVHSPKYDKNVFAMMWRTKEIYSSILDGTADVPEQFTKDVPNFHSFDRFADKWFGRGFWIITYFVFYYIFADQWWLWLFLPINLIMGPLHGAIINWVAHKYGYVNFKVFDTSKNIMPLDIFMMGEGYHNNHHANGQRANFGWKWHEIDPTYIVVWILAKIGVITMVEEKSSGTPQDTSSKTEPSLA